MTLVPDISTPPHPINYSEPAGDLIPQEAIKRFEIDDQDKSISTIISQFHALKTESITHLVTKILADTNSKQAISPWKDATAQDRQDTSPKQAAAGQSIAGQGRRDTARGRG
jgi:hypothetical protein